MNDAQIQVRHAGVEEAAVAAQLLHDFNREYDEPSPGVPALTENLREAIGEQTFTVLFGEEPGGTENPAGISVSTLHPSIWSRAPECYLAELYVKPPLRGRGIGRALLEAAIEEARRAGAGTISLNTGETDTEARGLYESHGFTNNEGGRDGPRMLYYEREL